MKRRASLFVALLGLILFADVGQAARRATVISYFAQWQLQGQQTYNCDTSGSFATNLPWTKTYKVSFAYDCPDPNYPQAEVYNELTNTGTGYGQCGANDSSSNRIYECAPSFGTPSEFDTGSAPNVYHVWRQVISHSRVDYHWDGIYGYSSSCLPNWINMFPPLDCSFDSGCTGAGTTDFDIISYAVYDDDDACSGSGLCPSADPEEIEDCNLQESTSWSWELCQCVTSPIVVDLDGDGLAFGNPHAGVWFDLDADGQPEQLSWTKPGSRDAFLVLDRNLNGLIDDGRELFGSATDQPSSTAKDGKRNGFLALAVFDEPLAGGNADGAITPDDTIWRQLNLWLDADNDGISDPGELLTLDAVGIAEISLKYTAHRTVDMYGNEHRYRGRVRMVNEPKDDVTGQKRVAIDVYLVKAR